MISVDEKTMMPIHAGVNNGLFPKKEASLLSMTKQINYFSVESMYEYSKKVEVLDGKIVKQKMAISGLVW
jgi:predicted enzyme related to lactoylglutathione lyase